VRCNSIQHHDLNVGVQRLYSYEAPLVNDIPSNDHSQDLGSKIIAQVLVQIFPDHTLRIQIQNPRPVNRYGKIGQFNDLMDSSSGLKNEADVAFREEFEQYLQQTYLINTKNGLIKKFFTSKDEPLAVTNLKRSFLHDLLQVQSELPFDDISNRSKSNDTFMGYNSNLNDETLRHATLELIEQNSVSSPLEITSPLRQEYPFLRNSPQISIQEQGYMNRLIDSISKKTGVPKELTGSVLDAFLEILISKVAEGNEVPINGFGSFIRRERKAFWSRNPNTGDEILIPAAYVPVFKAGKEFRDALNK